MRIKLNFELLLFSLSFVFLQLDLGLFSWGLESTFALLAFYLIYAKPIQIPTLIWLTTLSWLKQFITMQQLSFDITLTIGAILLGAILRRNLHFKIWAYYLLLVIYLTAHLILVDLIHLQTQLPLTSGLQPVFLNLIAATILYCTLPKH